MSNLPKITRKPVNTREMFDWGIISYKTFKQVKEMSNQDAIRYCDNLGLYQTWSYPKDVVISHITDNLLYNNDDRMSLIKKIMVVTDGRINPSVANMICKHFGV